MLLDTDHLAAHLRGGLAPVYLLFGDEPLLIEEALDAIRATAQAQGFDERIVLFAERGFDWNRLTGESQSLSLFSARRLLELRLSGTRPDAKGAAALTAYAGNPSPDTLLLCQTGKLDKSTREGDWFSALEGAGVAVEARPVDAAGLPGWIAARLRMRELAPDPGVVALLAHHFEGNLLAAAQEIDKLALTVQGALDLDAVQAGIADNARFNTFGLVDACLAGEVAKVVRMLPALRAEGAEPVLILWALGREVRQLAGISAALAAGRNPSEALRAFKVWSRRAPLVNAALGRYRRGQWLRFVVELARLDRVLKGRASGDIWSELERYCVALCGVSPLGRMTATG